MAKSDSFSNGDVAKLRQMEEALRVSEENYKLLLEYSPTAIFEIDYKIPGFISVNDAMCLLTGYSRDELLSMDPNDLLDQESREKFQKRIKRALSGEIIEDKVDFRVFTKDGRKLWVTLNINLTHKDGKPSGALVVGHDISGQKESEEILEQKNQKINEILNSISDDFYVLDPDWIFIYVNRRFTSRIGKEPEDLLGKNIWKMFPKHIGTVLEENFRAAMEKREIRRFEIGGKYTNAWYMMTCSPSKEGITVLGTEITQRKQMEEALRESEIRFKTLFRNLPVSTTVFQKIGEDFRIVDYNDLANEFTRGKMSDFVGKTAAELYKSHPEILKKFNLAFNSKNVQSYKNHYQKLSTGENIFLNLTMAFTPPDLIILHSEDLTEQKQAEDALRQSAEKLKYHLENSPLAVVEWDKNYFVTQWSNEAERLFGWKAEETLGKRIDSLNMVYEEDLPIVAATMERLSSGREHIVVSSNRNYTKTGNIIECKWYNSVLVDDKGEMLSVMSLIEDITMRKQAELKLQESNEKLEVALETGFIGVWEWNLKTRELIWDERLEKIFGIKPGMFEKTYLAFENCIHDEDIPHFREGINTTLKLHDPFETVFRTKPVDGAFKYISTKAIIRKDKSGNPVNLSGVCYDVTGMKRGTEQVLLKLNEELMRSNKDLQQFAYVASHDLQEPLRMVSSFTQMLAQRYKDKLDEDANEYIRYAVDGSKRMYDLLNGLLEYSRVQTKGKEFAKVDMNDILEKVILNLSLKIEEKNAVINLEKLPELFADESQMIQLIQNLIENSIKFSNGAPCISLSSKSDDISIIISVKDEGIGIESQYFERIFKIFQRLHQNDAYEGTGVGLAICKRIIERHGGRIWVESKPDIGSTFSFSIPKREA